MENIASILDTSIESELKINNDAFEVIKGSIDVLTTICSLIDPYTYNHQLRVSQLAYAIGKKLELPESQLEGIRVGSLLHDIGKIAIPNHILSKYGAISEYEFDIIKSHPQNGYKILSKLKFPWPIHKMILHHHERLDGTGYPVGLLDDDIIYEAKIIAVADVVEAISSHRPYRSSLGMETAIREISENNGTLYDKDAVSACMRLILEEKFEFDS
ncbi:MAG: HD domain-containing protein [Clostridiales bacterium]|nr:HD domain-containing protein [Clostridiales bacterium]